MFFLEHNCLWNHKSESYRNRLLRQSLLETLSSLLSDNQPVPFTGNNDAVRVVSRRTLTPQEIFHKFDEMLNEMGKKNKQHLKS